MPNTERERRALLGRATGQLTTGLVWFAAGVGLIPWAPTSWGAALGAFAVICGLVIDAKKRCSLLVG